MIVGYKMNDSGSNSFITRIDSDIDYPVGRVEEVLRYIDAKYVDDYDTDSLSEEAINYIMNSLDPHSSYISPKELADVNESMKGEFKGIGIESLYLRDTVEIVRVLKDGPAAASGVLPFDQIIKINGQNVAGTSLQFAEIRDLLRGKVDDTSVNISVKRLGANELLDLEVPLQTIEVNSSQAYGLLKPEIGYIDIDQFSETTYENFMNALEYLHDTSGVKNLIIDVRNNPGGLLPEVTKVVNQLIREKGRKIVYTKGQHSNKTEYKTNGKVFFPLEKIAVLTNEYSASASEILAGALQDWDRGLIVGAPTFGKGLVQEQYDLSNGGAIRLTVAKYYTPAGRSIQLPYDQNGYMDDLSIDSTSAVESLVIGRSLKDHSGIIPDILTNSPISDNDQLKSVLAYGFEYMYQKVKYESLTVADDNIAEGLLQYTQNKLNHNIDYTSLDQESKQYILSDLQRVIYDLSDSSDSPINAKALSKDPSVSKAIEYIESDMTLKQYLESL